MKIATYNVKLGGVDGDARRLNQVIGVIDEQRPDVIGLQETKLSLGPDNELIYALRNQRNFPYDEVIEGVNNEWMVNTGASLFSRSEPICSRRVGERVRAVEMVFQILDTRLSICNVYLSHVDEAARLPQIKEVLQELKGEDYSLIMGDFNALSPEDGLTDDLVKGFSPRMKEKYTRDGRLCFDTIEAVLEAGYVDIALQYHKPEEITDCTDLPGPTTGGGHTRPIRMDFIFANESLLPSFREFALVNQGLARIASDHFPWYVVLDTV